MTTLNTKDRLLLGIAAKGSVGSPRDLQAHGSTDKHHVTHLLWRLQKQGLVTFREKKRAGMRTLVHIQLTEKGQERVQELQP